MSQASEEYGADRLFDLPPLPAKVVTADGQIIDITSSIWRGRTTSYGGKYSQINWSLALETGNQHSIFTRRAWYLVQLYLADRLSKRNIRTVVSNYQAFLSFSRWLATQDFVGWLAQPKQGFNWSDYGESLARAFLNHGMNHTAEKGHYFWELRTFYTWGVAHQLPDFSSACLRILRSIRATSNLEGLHVRSRDVINGPFSPDERRAIKQALDTEQGTLQDRIIVRLFYELGINPHAATLLQNKDLRWYDGQGSRYFQLDVPRIKKRLLTRETRRKPITPILGSMLCEIQKGEPDNPLLFWLAPSDPL